jgi:hypothetical protein
VSTPTTNLGLLKADPTDILADYLTGDLADTLDDLDATIDALAGGGVTIAARTLTSADSPYTVLTTDCVLLCNCTGGAIALTLPAPAVGRFFRLKKIDSSANQVTVTPASGLIDGQANLQIAQQYAAYDLHADASNYFVF